MRENNVFGPHLTESYSLGSNSQWVGIGLCNFTKFYDDKMCHQSTMIESWQNYMWMAKLQNDMKLKNFIYHVTFPELIMPYGTTDFGQYWCR